MSRETASSGRPSKSEPDADRDDGPLPKRLALDSDDSEELVATVKTEVVHNSEETTAAAAAVASSSATIVSDTNSVSLRKF
jgi:hypothetical protein